MSELQYSRSARTRTALQSDGLSEVRSKNDQTTVVCERRLLCLEEMEPDRSVSGR